MYHSDLVWCVAADAVDRLGRSQEPGRPRRTEPRSRRVRDDEVTEPRQEVLHETLEEPIIIIDAEGRGDRALSVVFARVPLDRDGARASEPRLTFL